jgi:hypothetical protein
MKNKKDKAIANFGEYSENIYDFAKANQWNKADRRLNLLRKSSQALGSIGSLATKISDQLNALTQSVGARNRIAAMQNANTLTSYGATLKDPLEPLVPTEVTLLDYYGRKLEVGSLTQDLGQLKLDTRATRKTWNAVRNDLLQADGQKEAQKFDRLLNRLDVARSPKAYDRIALAILEEVDNVEKAFENRPPDEEEAD